MNDGALAHQRKAHKEWRKFHLRQKLDWPINNPNLNPFENVWKFLKDEVQHGTTCPKNLKELQMTLEKEWKWISNVKLHISYQSMLAKLQSMHKAKGYLIGRFVINPFWLSFRLQIWNICN